MAKFTCCRQDQFIAGIIAFHPVQEEGPLAVAAERLSAFVAGLCHHVQCTSLAAQISCARSQSGRSSGPFPNDFQRTLQYQDFLLSAPGVSCVGRHACPSTISLAACSGADLAAAQDTIPGGGRGHQSA
eukprot:3977845-Amphidinium_carterae.1